LRQFNVSESDLLSGIPSEKLNKLLDFEYRRARNYYAAAQKALPEEDRKHMVASEIMAEIYSAILEKLKRRRYPIFEQRVKLLRVHKAWILGKHMLRAKLGRY